MFNTNASTPFADDSRAQGSGRAHHTTSTPSNTRRPAISFGPLPPVVPHTSTRRPTIRPGMPFVETGSTSTQGPTIRNSLRPHRVNGVPSSRHPITGAEVPQPPGRSSEYAYLPAAASLLGRVPGARSRGEGGSRSHHANVQVINGLGDERSQALTHTGTCRALIQLPTIQSGSASEPHIGGSRGDGLRVHQTRAPRGCKFIMSTRPDIVMDVPFPISAIRGLEEDDDNDDAAFWDDGREESGGGWIQGFGPGGQHPGSGGHVFGMQQPGSRTGQLQIEGSRGEEHTTLRPPDGQRSHHTTQRPSRTHRSSGTQRPDARSGTLYPRSWTSRGIGRDSLAGYSGGQRSRHDSHRPFGTQHPSGG